MTNRPPRRLVLAGLGALAAGCAANAPSSAPFVWEHKVISSGNNFPDFNPSTPESNAVLAALHARRSPSEDAGSQAALVMLREKGFVKTGRGGLVPAICVVGLEDARWFGVDERVASETAALITARVEDVRRGVAVLPSFEGIAFDDVSLLILSDVLLDNWQIGHVEERWLEAQRPQRAGGRYYYGIFAREEASDREAFDIYGNQMRVVGDRLVAVYGNRRLTAPTLHSVSLADINARFGADYTSAQEGRAALVERFIAVAHGQDTFTAAERAGFAWLGLITAAGVARAPVMTEADYDALDRIAVGMTDALVAILNRHRPELQRRFNASPYAEAVSFEEYLIWWYHFFYSNVTDRLVRAGLVRVPEAGVSTYIIAG